VLKWNTATEDNQEGVDVFVTMGSQTACAVAPRGGAWTVAETVKEAYDAELR
jgi:hypothetical protein